MIDLNLIIYSVFAAVLVAICAILFGPGEDGAPSIACRLWRRYAVHRPIYELANFIMSRDGNVPDSYQNTWEQHSYAVEQGWEQSGTGGAEHVPKLAEQIGTCSDDELLDILSHVVGNHGEYRFAESRIGRFIGGRLEDRIDQVRAARGIEPPPPEPPRILRVRDNGAPERVIPFRETDPELAYQPPD